MKETIKSIILGSLCSVPTQVEELEINAIKDFIKKDKFRMLRRICKIDCGKNPDRCKTEDDSDDFCQVYKEIKRIK